MMRKGKPGIGVGKGYAVCYYQSAFCDRRRIHCDGGHSGATGDDGKVSGSYFEVC